MDKIDIKLKTAGREHPMIKLNRLLSSDKKVILEQFLELLPSDICCCAEYNPN